MAEPTHVIKRSRDIRGKQRSGWLTGKAPEPRHPTTANVGSTVSPPRERSGTRGVTDPVRSPLALLLSDHAKATIKSLPRGGCPSYSRLIGSPQLATTMMTTKSTDNALFSFSPSLAKADPRLLVGIPEWNESRKCSLALDLAPTRRKWTDKVALSSAAGSA